MAAESTPTEDNTYLTPIPQSTLDAVVITPPITTRLQAVLAARRELLTTRLEYSSPPAVLVAEEMKLAAAVRRAGFPDSAVNDRPADTQVWLVIFYGEFRIVPPDPLHTYTPEPPGYGCSAVILNASSSLPVGAGTIPCPPSE